MAVGGHNIKIHSETTAPLEIGAKILRIQELLETQIPELLAESTAEAMLAYAEGGLYQGHGKLTGTLKESLVRKKLRKVPGYYKVRVSTTATRAEQREAEYAMRAEAQANAGARTGVHRRGRKYEGIPLVGVSGGDEGYGAYVDRGSGPEGHRRPIPFMSTAKKVGEVYIRREAVEAAQAKIRFELGQF